MKTNRIKTIIIMLAAVAMAAMLTGCGRKEDSPISLVIIGGGNRNIPVLSSNCEVMHGSMYDAAYTHGNITMLNCDGSPQVFFQTSIPESEVKGLSENKKKRIAEDRVTQLQQAYSSVEPKVPEVNTLKAITMAARSLAGSSETKVLLINDGGIPTSGYLNFTNGIMDAEPEAIVDALKGMQALPDLTGVKCIWIGLGDTIAPQEELSERQKANLKAIWEEILYAAGADSVIFDGSYSTNMAYENAPAVTTIPAEDESMYVQTSKKVSDTKPIETVILDSARLQFIGDQAVFTDENQAESVLKSTAQTLISHPSNHVYVIGTTAGSSGNSSYTMNLSQARADVVKDKLVSMGVPESQMTAKGLGSTDPYHEYDLDANGNMIEEIAKRNRKTIIMDVNSAEAALLP